MTYGENSHQLRVELASLLHQHRIQHRLGAPGAHPVPAPTSLVERRQLGQLVQRYRQSALVWCYQAVTVADATIALAVTNEQDRLGPAVTLRDRLARSMELSTATLPTGEDLSASQDFPLMESWRAVAKAAALGGHDFPGLMDRERLSIPQRLVVLRDVADVTRALVVLDARYKNIPGWTPIRERGRLSRAAISCAAFTEAGELDYSVDQKGWRSPPATIDGGPLPGIGGVIQAQHNMLVHLARLPNALNLRRILNGQRIVCHEAARCASNLAPDLAVRWLEREETYERLGREMRNVGGQVGDGGKAAAEAANAVGRLRHLRAHELTDAGGLLDLDKVFVRTDARLAAVIEQGAAERLYFTSVRVPRLIEHSGRLVAPGRERYAPITASVLPVLLDISRRDLRSPSVAPISTLTGHTSREALRESINHRPTARANPAL